MKRACTLCHNIGFWGFGGMVCIAIALKIENSGLLCFLALPFTIILTISAFLNWKLPPKDKALATFGGRYIFHPYTDFLTVTYFQIMLFFNAFVEKNTFTDHLVFALSILFIFAILFTIFRLLRNPGNKKRK